MNVVTRITLALLGALAAIEVALKLPIAAHFSGITHFAIIVAIGVVGGAVGYVVGGLIAGWLRDHLRAIERAADRRSAGELIIGALGLVVGLIAAALAGIAVKQLPIVGVYLFIPMMIFVAYIFSRVAARKHRDILRLVGLRSRSAQARVIDTSAIIDGRLVAVLRTRFLSGALIVPDFVLVELQQVADSADPLKRARGRRGLEIIEEIKTSVNGGFSVRNTDRGDADPVDSRLVRLARELGASIVTTDYNLNKVAQIQGIEVLNINELANALKPAVLPGEPLSIKVIREGREYDQGVGYLDDGTMIVVEGGRRLLGQRIDVEVTSILQSPSGKMIFTRPIANEVSA